MNRSNRVLLFPPALADAFPFVYDLSHSGQRALHETIQRKTLKARTRVLEEGEPCPSLLLVEHGHLRVFKTSASGREITLYRVRPGDTCVVSMSAVLSDAPYPATVEAPVECEVVAIPAAVFRRLFESEPALQRVFVQHLSSILTEMMSLVAEVAFRKVDQRLARLLLEESARNEGCVAASHEELATHLGTAREVVSRLIENFKDDGLISAERRNIRVIDKAGLSRVVGDER